ncbi:MAG: hypothetical protein JNK75_02830 [Betaproteobacteria bacterium]|nr:hypothetical protein [Betaproteobacteria bacterium]
MKLMLSEATGVEHGVHRTNLEAIITGLRHPARPQDGIATAAAIEAALVAFEEKSIAVRSAALNSSILRVDTERSEFVWLADIHARFAAAVRALADRASNDDSLPAAIKVRYCAYALLAGGHECKWRLIAGLRSAPSQTHLHHLQLGRAQADETADVVMSIPIEGSHRETSVEAVYMRALLLERLASGNLNAQQIEILDEWLLAWMHSLIVSRKRPEDENALVADLTGTRGFTLSLRGEPEGDPRGKVYLPLKPVMRQLDHAIERFHQGLIFPGFGLGMHFRIEEHAGVIDYLSREFALLMARREFKQPRKVVEGAREAAVFVGMNDIVSRAVQVSDASLLRIADPLAQAHTGTGTFSALDPAMRILTVSDISETGFGLIAGPSHRDALSVGDLAAVRLSAQSPAVLCVVTRKVALPEGHAALFGLRIVTRQARPVTLEYLREDDTNGSGGQAARPPATAIFVPGEDTSGRGDSLIVSETVYRGGTAFRVRFGGATFRVALGRVKKQGRGWKMAAFDVTALPEAAAPHASPQAGVSVSAPAASRHRS